MTYKKALEPSSPSKSKNSLPNPSKMEQCWECTFLKIYTHLKTKLASKFFSTFGLQRQQLACVANLALMIHMGRARQLLSLKAKSGNYLRCSFCFYMCIEAQKTALTTLFHFARVRAAICEFIGKGIKVTLVSDGKEEQ